MNYVTALGREEVVDFVTIVLKSVTVCVGGVGVGWGGGVMNCPQLRGVIYGRPLNRIYSAIYDKVNFKFSSQHS